MKRLLPREPLGLAFALFTAALVLVRMVALPETDIFFSIHHGQNILGGQALVAPDTWNFLVQGRPWMSNSWLWDVVLAIAYDLGGLIGVSILNGLTYVLCILAASAIASSVGLRRWKKWLLVTAFALITISFFTARAVNTDILLPVVYVWLLLHFKARLNPRAGFLAIIGLTFLIAALGMNLHLSGTIYGLLLPSFAALFIAGSVKSKMIAFFSVGLATLAGVLCTPYGVYGLTQAGAVADASRRLIVEWNPPNIQTYLGWLVLFVCALTAPLLIWLGRHRLILPMLLIGVLELATLDAIRFVVYLMVVLFMLGAKYGAQWHLPTTWHPKRLTAKNSWLVVALAGFTTLTCALLTITAYLDGGPSLAQVNPKDYESFAPHSRVLSNPSQGSAIPFYRPGVQVAVDGRNDLLGSAQYTEATHILAYASVEELRSWLNKYKVDGIFISNEEIPALAPRLQKLNWKAHPGQFGIAYTR